MQRILERHGYSARTMSKGKALPHREAKVLGYTLKRIDLADGEHVLNISSEAGNYLNVQWRKSGGVHATRFVPGPWEQTIRDLATAIDPDWPVRAGLSFIDFDALKVPESLQQDVEEGLSEPRSISAKPLTPSRPCVSTPIKPQTDTIPRSPMLAPPAGFARPAPSNV